MKGVFHLKFSCDKQILTENISVVLKAVSPKSNYPLLEGIYVKVTPNNVKMLGNDFEIAIESNFEAQTEEDGEIVLNARMLFEIVRKLPDGIITISSDENLKTTIFSEKAKYEIFGLNASEYPAIDSFDSEQKFSISKLQLKSIIRQTAFSIGTNENKITFTGAYFEVNGDVLKVVALDGYRMAYRKENISNTLLNSNFIIPGKTLNELSKILNDKEEEVEICFSDKKATIKIDNYVVYSRLIEGEFFNYEHIIPTVSDLTVTTDTKDIINAIERTSLLITTDSKSPVKMDITENNIYMSCISRIGKAEDSFFCETEGNNLEIGFNHKYLLDALKACECEKIKMQFTTSLSPLVIVPIEGDSFLYLVLPVRLKNE